MFGKIVRYVRKKRSRVRAQDHHVVLLADRSDTQLIHLKTQDIQQNTVVTNLDQDISPVGVHSLHRPCSLDKRTDAPEDSDHDGRAAQKVAALTHAEDLFMAQQEGPAGGDAIVDSLTLGRMWNAFASINTLPDEVLVQVFLCTRLKRHTWSKDISPVEPTRYMAVCRRWRDTIVGHACFWDTILVDEGTKWLRLALSRSHQAMLHLEFGDLPTLASVLPDVIPHRDRIRTLVLGYHPRYSEFMTVSSLIAAPFKSLTRLKIRASTSYRPDVGYFVLHPEHYPQLTHLELQGLHVQWTASLLSQLASLSLSKCSTAPSPMHADTFLDVLQHGQHLKSLVLDGFISAACSNLPSRSRHPFSLSNLEEFRITDSAQWIQQLMTFVQSPTQHAGWFSLSGKVAVGLFGNAPISHRGFLLSPEVTFFPAHTTSLLVIILWPATTFILQSCDSQVHTTLTLDLPAHMPLASNTILASIKGTLDTHLLRALDLRIPMHNVDRDAFDAYLDASPSLRSLHIGATARDNNYHPLPVCIFDSLVSQSHALDKDGSDVGRGRVRCPNLTSLGLGGLAWDGGAVMDAALDCLKSRAALDAPQLEFLNIRVLPRPLEGGLKGWRAADLRYTEQLQKMVSNKYSFFVGGTY
ncbi:hypothetical protein VTO73DRAFT_4001 [Trametes versicolor]